MREIKFRAKRLCDGKWAYGVPITMENVVHIINDECEQVCDARTLGQFTGLTDMGDKGVFEGDILRGIAKNGQVIWSHRDLEFAVVDMEKISDATFWYNRLKNWKPTHVIGNIYDNPEYLKNKVDKGDK